MNRLAMGHEDDDRLRMGHPETPVTLTPEQVAELLARLGEMRHNVNNLLSLVVAAAELIRRKPESAARFIDNLSDQPQRIVEEVQRFSDAFERTLSIRRD